MNKTIKTLAIGLLTTGLTAATFAQGTINFDTFNANTAKGGVYFPGTTTSADATIDGQLFYSDTSAANPIANFTAFSPVLQFSTANGTIIDPTLIVDPNQFGGNHVFVQLRVWNASAGGTWATAVGINPPATGSAGLTEFGNSSVMTLTLGGDDGLGQGDPPVTPGTANSFTSFAMTAVAPIPEPSTIILGGLGAAALMAFRRRK